MLTIKLTVPLICVLFGIGNSWNIFPFLSKTSLETFTKQQVFSWNGLKNILSPHQTDDGTLTGDKTGNSTGVKEPEKTPNFTSTGNRSMGLLQPIYLQFVGGNLSTSISREILPDKDFLHKILGLPNSLEPKNKVHSKKRSLSENVKGRSDDQDLVSDQEPDATSKGHKKYQHIYLSPRSRLKGYMIPDKTGYEISFDSVSSPYEHNGIYTKGYYLDDDLYPSSSDLYAAAGSHVSRGHSRGDHGGYGGYGHGGGGNNGLTDPFTILGGLAFLTYLAMLIQQGLNRTGGTGRELNEWRLENLSRKIPVILTRLQFNDKSVEKASSPEFVKQEQRKDIIGVQNRLNGFREDLISARRVPNVECTPLCQLLRVFQILPKTVLNANEKT